jgi:hypothetical protein
MENGGVDINFTSGFPSMSMHYLGADSGNCAVGEASQNLEGQKASSNKWHFLSSKSLLLYAQIHNIHSTRTLQRSKSYSETVSLPSRHPYHSVVVLSHPFSTRRIVVFSFPFPSLPHPPTEYPNPFHPNLSQSVPITRRQPHSLVHNPQISTFLLPVLIDWFPENLAHCMCFFPFLNRVVEFPRLNLRPSNR